MAESTIIKRGKRIVAAAALATLGMVALGAPTSAAPAQVPDISITPESLDFGRVPVGDVSEEQILTFTNGTASDATLELTVRAAAGSGHFEFTDTFTCDFTDNPQAVIVPASGSCETGIVFVPQDVGQSTLTIDWIHEGTAYAGTTELFGEGVADQPAPTCAPPTGAVSGPLHQLGTQLGPLGANLVNLAKELCAAGL